MPFETVQDSSIELEELDLERYWRGLKSLLPCQQQSDTTPLMSRGSTSRGHGWVVIIIIVFVDIIMSMNTLCTTVHLM